MGERPLGEALVKPPKGHSLWLYLLEWEERWGTEPVAPRTFSQTFFPHAKESPCPNKLPSSAEQALSRVRKLARDLGAPIQCAKQAGAVQYRMSKKTVKLVRDYFQAWDRLLAAEEALLALTTPGALKAPA